MNKDKGLTIKTKEKHSTLDVWLFIIKNYLTGILFLLATIAWCLFGENNFIPIILKFFITFWVLIIIIKNIYKYFYISKIIFFPDNKLFIINIIYPFLKINQSKKFRVKTIKGFNIYSRYGKSKAIEIITDSGEKVYLYPINYHFLGKDKVFNFIKEINQYL